MSNPSSSLSALAQTVTTEFQNTYREAEALSGGWMPDDGNYQVWLTGINVTDDLTFGLTDDRNGPSVPAFGISFTCQMQDDPASGREARSFKTPLEVFPRNPAAVSDPKRAKALKTKMGIMKGKAQIILGRDCGDFVGDLLAIEKLIADGSSPDGNGPPLVEVQVKTSGKYTNVYVNKRVS